eukprot:6071718-Pleurochrysis_carterae.AAC.1
MEKAYTRETPSSNLDCMTLLGVAVMRSVCRPDAVVSAATLPTSVVILCASSMRRKLFSGREYLPTKRAGRMTLTKESNVAFLVGGSEDDGITIAGKALIVRDRVGVDDDPCVHGQKRSDAAEELRGLDSKR